MDKAMEMDDAPVDRALKVFDFPHLVNESIFRYLNFADICRLRLSSKELNSWITPILKDTAVLRLEVSEGTCFTFQFAINTTLQMGLPLGQLSITSTLDGIYSDPSITQFISTCSSEIKNLKLCNYVMDSCPQFNFLDSLSNLIELEIMYMETRHGTAAKLPSCFKNLKSLKFGTISGGDNWNFLVMGSLRLNYIRLPSLALSDQELLDMERTEYETLKSLIHRQKDAFPGDPKYWLTTVDFQNFNNLGVIETSISQFLSFYNEFKASGISIRNISSEYFDNILARARTRTYHPNDRTFESIKSMILHSYFWVLAHANFDGVQELKIPSVRQLLNGWRESPLEQEWMKLKSIKIHFDLASKEQSYQTLVESLLVGPNPGRVVEEFMASFEPTTSPALSGTKFASSLPHLKRLTLINWNPPNTAFVKVWQNLPLLVELWLENCPSLGNVALIGKEESDPAFLKLTKLTKLTLVLDDLPKLTDRAFKDVFRHMKLKEFQIRSTGPLKQITRFGINWLLTGDFGKTIETFPFDTWSAADVSPEEMIKIKAQFKSLIN